ncbi:O-antigen ligase family protein [Pontibacter sp. HSC-14F20]|uniref:O-antigen ligase family protein n=1 Tax=Pontibacter sp. HSC-14F20 TaxID=2864136 RepID=UPI001C73A71F|nr:O-antigen ligase family protein [Pontibacter sp. HSC-14F20]MBX0331699.1 O-antigen ligase family protein [Pontibacter sp. HSC-14F20]
MPLLQRLYNKELYHALLLVVAVLIPNTDSLPIRLASMSIILLAVWWIASGHYKQKLTKLKHNKFLWLFMALFLINLPGLLLRDYSADGYEILSRKLPLLLFPLVIGTSFDLSGKQRSQILIAFILGLFLMSLFTFREGIAVLLDREDLTTMVRLTLLHRPYSGLFSAFGLVALMSLFRQYTSISARVLLAAGILYFIFYIYILYAKMTVVALLVLAFVLAMVWATRKLGKGVVIGGGMVGIIAAAFFVSNNEKASTVAQKIIKFEDFSYQEYDIHLVSSINIRYINWGCSIELLKKDNNWLTGLGIGHTQQPLNACYKDLNPWIYELKMNSHNEYLDEMLRNGIVGLSILLLVLLIPAINSLKQTNYTYLSFLILFAVAILTENFLSRQAGIMYFALFASVFAFHDLKPKEIDLKFPEKDRLKV